MIILATIFVVISQEIVSKSDLNSVERKFTLFLMPYKKALAV